MRFCFALVSFALFPFAPARGQEPGSRPSASTANYRDWKVSGGTVQSIRYSTLDQINRGNVSKLEVAWTFDTHDVSATSDMECNPIVIDGVFYATTPRLRVIALDAGTGRRLWTFDPEPDNRIRQHSRGVAFWSPSNKSGGQRIFVTARHYLYALDAKTG